MTGSSAWFKVDFFFIFKENSNDGENGVNGPFWANIFEFCSKSFHYTILTL